MAALISPKEDMCALFSLSGRITPLKELGQQRGGAKCEIKEVLPMKIYGREADTKNGLEYFVNGDGTFYHEFPSLLVRKSVHSRILPEFDRFELATPPSEASILSLLV